MIKESEMGHDESAKPGAECAKCGVWVYPGQGMPSHNHKTICIQCYPAGINDLTYGEIWKTLSSVDVQDHTAERGNFTYLSWSWAWGVLMEQYPVAEYCFPQPTFFEDGTIEVHCRITIGTCAREMWLPVMDHKNNAIKTPDARKINDAKMRCLVKCIAMFGLGHYIYAGEDVPTNTLTKSAARNFHTELVKELREVDSLDALKSFGIRKKGDIATLPDDWQDDMRREYKEAQEFWNDKENAVFDQS